MARDGDGLFRRGDIWYFKYRGSLGGYREKSTGHRKQSDARVYKHDFLEKLRQNQLPTDEAKWTLQQALDRWLEFRAATRPKASVAAEQTAGRHLLEVLGGGPRLCSITIWDVRRYQMERLKTVGPKTINNELLPLVAVLKSAKLWRPLEELYTPLPVPKQGPGRALTPQEVGKLIVLFVHDRALRPNIGYDNPSYRQQSGARISAALPWRRGCRGRRAWTPMCGSVGRERQVRRRRIDGPGLHGIGLPQTSVSQ